MGTGYKEFILTFNMHIFATHPHVVTKLTLEICIFCKLDVGNV